VIEAGYQSVLLDLYQKLDKMFEVQYIQRM